MLNAAAQERWLKRERSMSLILRSSDSQIQYSFHDPLFAIILFASLWACQSPKSVWQYRTPLKLQTVILLSSRDGRGTCKYQTKGGAGGCPQVCLSFCRRNSTPWKPLLQVWLSWEEVKMGYLATLQRTAQTRAEREVRTIILWALCSRRQTFIISSTAHIHRKVINIITIFHTRRPRASKVKYPNS